MIINNAVADLPISAVSGILSRAAAAGWSDVIPMAGGEPRFPSPTGALEAIDPRKRPIDELTKYSPFLGRGDLLDAIRHKLRVHNNVTVGPDELICVPGGSSALHIAISCCAEPGAEVIVQDPCWEHYLSIIRLTGCTPVRFRMVVENGRLVPDLDHLEKMVGPRTRAILINTPLNPQGAMLNASECKALCAFADKHGLALICDEEYEAFVHAGNKHLSPREFDPNTILIQSFSKSFALTGIRLAYISGPAPFIEAARRYSLYSHMYPSSPAQAMALGALSGDWQGYLADVAALYESKMERFADRLRNLPGVHVERPEGGLYLFPRFDGFDDESLRGRSVANCLIEDHHLLCVPGEVAGDFGRGHVRLFFGVEDDQIDAAADRIARFALAGAEVRQS